MRFRVLMTMVVFAFFASSASAGITTREIALLWISDLNKAEELVSAALETRDWDELKTQELALFKLMGRSKELDPLPDAARVSCVAAAQTLANFANAFRSQTPARALVLAKMDARSYLEQMPMCEKLANYPTSSEHKLLGH